MENYKVWECRLVVPENTVLPDGFDLPLRVAVVRVLEIYDMDIVALFSGWGYEVTDVERRVIERKY